MHVSMVFRCDERILTDWEIINMSSLSNNASYKVRIGNALTYIVFIVINYAHTFEEEYETPFVEIRIRVIVDAMDNSNVISNVRDTYARLERVGKLLVCNSHLRLPLKEIRKGNYMHI